MALTRTTCHCLTMWKNCRTQVLNDAKSLGSLMLTMTNSTRENQDRITTFLSKRLKENSILRLFPRLRCLFPPAQHHPKAMPNEINVRACWALSNLPPNPRISDQSKSSCHTPGIRSTDPIWRCVTVAVGMEAGLWRRAAGSEG